MKKLFTFILLAVLITNLSFAQKLDQIDENTLDYIAPKTETDETQKRGIPSSIMLWDTNDLLQINGSYIIKLRSNTGFTCFGIGWKTASKDVLANSFKITYKIIKNPSAKNTAEKVWGIFQEEEGYLIPSETGTDYYWSDLLFGYDEQSRQDLLIVLSPPKGVDVSEIRIDFMNLSNDIDPSHAKNMMPDYNTKSCPAVPSIIPRADWCGSYTACTYASYTPTTIDPTHAVIHHGASPDTYTDGYAVVRSYWNYHVNTLNWSDIGYNYLVDKYGNLFQGRKNSNAPSSDVRGAHAGASNSYSIGVNFLGNADVTLPTTDQLNKLYDFLGWWFDHKDLDPASSANIVLQSGGTASKPRICGHKDVNVGGTSCPGTTLYSMLPTVRTNVKAVIDACNQLDVTKPTTSVANPGTWVSTNFTANFTDADNVGVAQRFYQVLDYNGSEWRANKTEGFFNDNFNNAIHSDWSTVSGTWSIAGGMLKTADEANSNTNIYSEVTQSTGSSYMYNFKMKITGSGTNKRAGIHFFCDDANQVNRNNSYMVYFRADGNRAQIYEYTSNTMYLRTDVDCNVTAGTLYDIKIIYNSVSGKIDVFQNDILVTSWTDSTPKTVGNYVSLRSGNCITEYDDFKVFKSRSSSAAVTVGNSSANQIRYQSSSSTAYAGQILSVVLDAANNISDVAVHDQKVDFWGPYAVSTVNDGTTIDIDTQTGTTSLSANWTAASDANNTIASYSYAIGTSPGGTNIVNWTNTGLSQSFSKTGLSLLTNTTYYVTVTSKNAAGLSSVGKTSDGVEVVVPTLNYCTTKGNIVSDEWINRVVIESIDNTSGANGGYADFTNLSASVTTGDYYSIIIYPSWSGTIYSEYYSAWIDYNIDGDFDDAGEQLFTQSATTSSYINKSFQIPTSAVTGLTRMRVSMKYGGYPTPCETFTYGEVEDYTVIIGGTKSVIDKKTVDIYDNNLELFILYPNPTEDIFYVDLKNFAGDVDLHIYSLSGVMVLNTKINNYSNSINVSNLSPGVYYVTIKNNGKVYSKKLIKQ